MLQIKEDFVIEKDDGKSYRIEGSSWHEPFTDNLGQLFRFLKKEYGRCVSRVYQDTPDGTADPIGWVFEKRRSFEDIKGSYLQQVWVTYRRIKEGT